MSSAGDVNGDGVDDLIIGAPFNDVDAGGRNRGASYIVFGKDASGGGGFAASIDLEDLNGFNGFRIDGVIDSDNSGASVSAAGDINNDGFDDLIIGAPSSDLGGSDRGESYVIYGRERFYEEVLLSTDNYAITLANRDLVTLPGGTPINGDNSANTLTGTSGGEVIQGGAGNDIISPDGAMTPST
ncbi:MAG: FG-GAP repeat protein [Alphaproteobacteria bacterium]|nr:FG-GAP repeat protein [Alphaproteobacteria bacterium]